jgi:hypothetical protein
MDEKRQSGESAGLSKGSENKIKKSQCTARLVEIKENKR